MSESTCEKGLDAKVTNNFLLLPPPPCSLGFIFDNRWVVPYNPYLTMPYQCHINVEVCSSITTVKYLYKYVYKGHDRALAVVQPEVGALPAAAPIYGHKINQAASLVPHVGGLREKLQ
jgi:hypothetical protein